MRLIWYGQSRWSSTRFRRTGEAALRGDSVGRTRCEPIGSGASVENRSPNETPLWTCPRVADLIQRKFDVSYHAGHVWKILVGLRWSPQRPVGKARERNEKQIRSWKRKRWPAIKKKPARKGARSSSSTRVE